VRLLELAVNPLFNSVGGQTHELRFGPASRDGLANLETPFPQARLNLREGEIDAQWFMTCVTETCLLPPCVYRKPKPGRSDGEVHQVSRVN
jgi:hypothetical protein